MMKQLNSETQNKNFINKSEGRRDARSQENMRKRANKNLAILSENSCSDINSTQMLE